MRCSHVFRGLPNRYRCGHLWRCVVAFLLLSSAAPALAVNFDVGDFNDWSKWGTWSRNDPKVRATAKALNEFYQTPARGASWYASAGGATVEAVRGINDVWEVKRNVPVTAAQIGAMARFAVRGVGWVGMGVAAVQMMQDAGLFPGPDGQPYIDAGGYAGYPDGVTPSVYRYRMGNGSNCYTLYGAFLSIETVDGKWKSCSGYSGSGNCTISENYGNYPSGQFKRASCPGGAVVTIAQISTSCSSPDVYLPDGTCGSPPASGSQPASDQAIEDAISDGIGSNPSAAPDVAQDAAENGAPIPGPIPPWTGPSSFPGASSSSTSTGPSGTTTTTRQTQHQVEYGPDDDITVTDEETITTINPDGSTTTTTETSTGTSSPGSVAQDFCKQNPGASACAPLDTIEDAELPAQDIPIDFSISSQSGSCPAPIELDILGTVHSLSWQPLCDFAESLSPLVRALGAFSAGVWLFFMLRR